jgi:hypothetical protein
MSEPRVKGIAVINARGWIDERLGAGWFSKTLQKIDPEWPERLLPGDWYPVRPEFQAFECAYEAMDGYDSLEDMLAALSGDVALNDLNGILRAFLWAATPRMFLRTTPMIWDTYVDFTKISSIDNTPGRYAATIVEVPEDLVVWVAGAWRGFLGPALELAGGVQTGAQIRDRRKTLGADTWEFVYELSYELQT